MTAVIYLKTWMKWTYSQKNISYSNRLKNQKPDDTYH